MVGQNVYGDGRIMTLVIIIDNAMIGPTDIRIITSMIYCGLYSDSKWLGGTSMLLAYCDRDPGFQSWYRRFYEQHLSCLSIACDGNTRGSRVLSVQISMLKHVIDPHL